MKLTVTVKLGTTQEQHAALLQTLRTCNAACERISQVAFQSQTFRQFDLHQLTYYPIREKSALPAQHVIRTIAKVADAYKLGTDTLRTFQPTGAIELDSRLLSWKVQEQTVGITTLRGRLSIPFLCSVAQKALLRGQRGQSDLMLRDGVFYLACSVTVEDAQPFVPTGVIGIDLGIVHLATDSQGNHYTGEPVRKVRRKYRRLRQLLAPRKSASARKHRKKLARKEARFVKDTNHRISKQLVQLALDRQKALAVETLTGIRPRGNGLSRAMRTELNNWAFLQLKLFLIYKSKRAGVTVIEVDARYSSQECSACHHTERANRRSQERFCCQCCGLELNADYNASLNLKARGVKSLLARQSDALMFREEADASDLGQAHEL